MGAIYYKNKQDIKFTWTFCWAAAYFYKEKFDFIISFSSLSEMLSRSDLS